MELLPLERARLALYLIGLGIAFALYLLVHGGGAGLVFWLLAGIAIGGAAYGAITDMTRNGGILQAAVLLASLLAVAVPLAGAVAQPGKLTGAISVAAVWPQILVLLFASRVLAELSELRFVAAWRDPFLAGQTAPVQSVAAALVLGALFTLLFYLLAAQLHGRPDAASGIIVTALLGDTAIHHAIVLLFFVITAFLVDAVLIYIRDRIAVGSFRTSVRGRGAVTPGELRDLIDRDLARWSHTRAMQFIRQALDRRETPRAGQSSLPMALAGFHHASRRFVKGLVTLLPLLGFLGTVIGLSIALAELPRGTAGANRGAFDIGGSLAGLAIKFETTLLGLMGGMIASLAIAWLEKSETELAADCELMVAATQRQNQRQDQSDDQRDAA